MQLSRYVFRFAWILCIKASPYLHHAALLFSTTQCSFDMPELLINRGSIFNLFSARVDGYEFKEQYGHFACAVVGFPDTARPWLLAPSITRRKKYKPKSKIDVSTHATCPWFCDTLFSSLNIGFF
ncbi:hypothetical protein BU26DRAFT_561489 [Trematosphaeria pertusa]|uniref:Uncharacterized protein n=1 Tax=Trematosphaeria pertusa TaxID=390896 RepID=A0A6A6IN63_9PLEO|nr:uncharacterized protein BU26DRAFT_561489 [Trematosphaeria pertusa]KAF2251677.1 hypothetical protein BU26DRAFT_561489 [Trematosphaeria pertusa]